MDLPSDANVLISSSPMAASVCPVAETDPTVNVDLSKICSGRSCSYYKDVYGKLEYRSEQCAKEMYLLIVAEPDANIPSLETMALEADYVSGVSCNSVYRGVHETQSDVISCGRRKFSFCEEGISCAKITCSNEEKGEKLHEEDICVPRYFDSSERDAYCQNSGLALTKSGEKPGYNLGMWIYIGIGVGSFFLCMCMCACYYNYRLHSYNEAPFPIPAFCPDCLFPKVEPEVEYGKNLSIVSDESFGQLQNNDPLPNRETRYKPPSFDFDN